MSERHSSIKECEQRPVRRLVHISRKPLSSPKIPSEGSKNMCCPFYFQPTIHFVIKPPPHLTPLMGGPFLAKNIMFPRSHRNSCDDWVRKPYQVADEVTPSRSSVYTNVHLLTFVSLYVSIKKQVSKDFWCVETQTAATWRTRSRSSRPSRLLCSPAWESNVMPSIDSMLISMY